MKPARILFLLLIISASSLPAAAHELFLKPQDYRLEPGAEAVIPLFNGTFNNSENIITRDRMIDVTVHGGGQTQHPAQSQWRDESLTAVLSHPVAGPGTYAIGVSTKPRMINLSAVAFKKYLAGEGVLDTLADFQANSNLDEVRERYSKHVRSIVQVGEALSDDHQIGLDYPVEILLEDNPYAATVGGRLSLQVLRNGKPLADQLVYASHGAAQQHVSGNSREGAQQLRTDADGRAQFTADKAGVWYIALIHMEKLTGDPDADYESNWSTVTFEIPTPD